MLIPPPLLRFKWKLTIESQYFQAKQLIFSAGGRDLNLVLVSTELRTLVLPHHVTADSPPLKTNVLLKSSERYQNYSLCHNSCHGLVCLYDYHNLNIFFNPATLMASTFPCFQHQHLEVYQSFFSLSDECFLVSVACSVFRWIALLVNRGERNKSFIVRSLHTETFQVISKAPFVMMFAQILETSSHTAWITVCAYPFINLPNKTWEQIYSLVNRKIMRSLPLAILEKNKLLCCGSSLYSILLMIYDNKTKSVDSVSIDTLYSGIMVCYVESLISIL
ncbi:unnamed protein product [Arabidopsis halleri]